MTPSDPKDAPQVNEPTPAEPQDMSQFIRTYAKDVAHITGKGNVAAVQKPRPVATPAPVVQAEAGKGELSDGVQFEAVTESLQGTGIDREEKPRERLQVDSAAELEQYVEHGKAPSITPAPVIPEPVVTEHRESILDRLRARMTPAPQAPSDPAFVPAPTSAPVFAEAPRPDVHALPPLQKAPPTPPISTPPVEVVRAPEPAAPAPTVAPVREPYREPIPEPVTVAPLPTPKAPVTPPSIPVDAPERFHSYSTDFKDNVSKTGASDFSVLAAEQDAKRSEQPAVPQKKTGRGLLPVLAGVLLLILAGGGAYAGYLYIGARTNVPAITLNVPSLIFADEYKKIEGQGTELQRALAIVADGPLVTGNALVTYIAQPATGEAGVIAGTPAPGGYLIKALNLPAPDLLLRNITQDSTVGVIHEGGETRAFFVLRVSSYERTFAGMLTWEPLMMRDLGLLYPLYPEEVVAEPVVDLSATTTPKVASTTPRVAPVPAVSRVRFEDTVVANRDVRILRDTRGRSLLLYGYADKETLIIARNEAAFASLLTRLAAKSK